MITACTLLFPTRSSVLWRNMRDISPFYSAVIVTFMIMHFQVLQMYSFQFGSIDITLNKRLQKYKDNCPPKSVLILLKSLVQCDIYNFLYMNKLTISKVLVPCSDILNRSGCLSRWVSNVSCPYRPSSGVQGSVLRSMISRFSSEV